MSYTGFTTETVEQIEAGIADVDQQLERIAAERGLPGAYMLGELHARLCQEALREARAHLRGKEKYSDNWWQQRARDQLGSARFELKRI